MDAKLPARVPLSQSVVSKEEQKPVAVIPISESVIKKEDKKSAAAISLSQSAIKEEEKPVASTPHPRSAVVENNAKHTQSQNAQGGERPPKKLKLSQEATVKNMTPAVTETRPLELPSRQAVISLKRLFLYPTCYSCRYFSLDDLGLQACLLFYLMLQPYRTE